MSNSSEGRVSVLRREGVLANYEEIKTELFRKVIHIMVALVPALASINITATEIFLGVTVAVYSVCEFNRLKGRPIFLISGITAAAARKRDQGHFVLGPVTLAVGAMLALMLYPSAAAAAAIYALAFGDSAASLVGKFFGRITIPGFGTKTLEGTLACFSAVYIAVLALTAGDVITAAVVAVLASLIELVPVKDLDNLLIPVGTGLAAAMLM